MGGIDGLKRGYVRACIAALLTLPLGVPVASAQQTSIVGVDEVRVEPLRQTAPVVGRFVACRSGVVAARISGPVGEMRVDVGDRVEKSETMAMLVRDRYAADLALRAAQVAEAEATIRAKLAELELRNQELRRIERLRQSPAFSEGRFDDKRQEVMMTRGDVSESEALLDRARAELRLAEIAYRDTQVLAPYSGVVSKRHTEIGAHVNPGDPVVSLIDDSCLEIEADVPQGSAQFLTAGTVVPFDVSGTAMAAKVRAVIPDENPLTRTRAVRFEPELSETGNLVPGQSVTLKVPVGPARDILTVHKDAVLNRKGESVVFVVDDGMAASRSIQLGESVGSRFEVLNGLTEGDVAVVRGNERLYPGQPVEAANGAEG